MRQDAPSVAPLMLAARERLAAVVRVPVGSAAKPAGSNPPYLFVSRPSVTWDGSLANPYEMARCVIQVQCVALTVDDVDDLEAWCRDALTDPPVAVGWRTLHYQPEASNGPQIDRDADPDQPLYYSTPQWLLVAQPVF